MKGWIEMINHNREMIAVRTKDDEYSVLELVGGYSPELGDEISGELNNLGGETVFNVTHQEEWDVYIQDIYASKESATNMIR